MAEIQSVAGDLQLSRSSAGFAAAVIADYTTVACTEYNADLEAVGRVLLAVNFKTK